jgi:hypothetical protein
MRTFKHVIRSTSAITTLAAGILLVAAQGTYAGNHGGNHDGNHGSNHSGQGPGGDTRRAAADHGRNAIVAERRGNDKSDRKPNFDLKWGRDRERLGDGKKMAAPVGKPIDKPVEANSGKPAETVASKPIASSSASPAGVTSPVNTIHPIPSPPAGNVTISNGVTKYEIPNGAGGVSAYSSDPGKITVTNGKDSVTLNGGSVTVSNALGVGAAQNNVQVGARNGEGKTVVSVAPTPEAPTPRGTVTGFDMPGGPVAKTALKIIDAVPIATFGPPIAAGYGLAKDGVKGAVHGVKESAKVVYDFLTW